MTMTSLDRISQNIKQDAVQNRGRFPILNKKKETDNIPISSDT